MWIPCLEDDILPHERTVAEAGAAGGGSQLADAVCEEQRLLYVAVRAP